ncbi:MAG: ABC transporter substrate-binding protein [Rhizobiales bacterium]|nr:ABC transporter substrate-binding protein [Hyphomicrobiales bacterium]
MRRREFISLIGGSAIALWPTQVSAQQNLRRVAVLDWVSEAGAARLEPFKKGLRDEGLIDGLNIAVTYHFARGNAKRADALAAEIVRENVDVIVAFATPAAHAAKRATESIPIVFGAADPLGTGLVSNLARPGGNLTGTSAMLPDLEAKRLELLGQLIPGLKRVAYIASTVDPAAVGFVRQAEEAAARAGIGVATFRIAGADQVDGALADAVRGGAQAVIIQTLFTLDTKTAKQTALLTARHRLPAIGTFATFAQAGGLISFGPPPEFVRQRAAQFVARILAGTPPGELAVEQPTAFRLVLNQKTARELGINIPVLTLARADEVIE